MTHQIPTIREELNASPPNRNADLLRTVDIGHVLAALIADSTATEAGVVPTVSDTLGTLAAIPVQILDVIAVAGTFTGRMEMLVGDASVLPTTGQFVWNGGLTIALLTTDAITDFDIWYTVAGNTTSLLDRRLEQDDTV